MAPARPSSMPVFGNSSSASPHRLQLPPATSIRSISQPGSPENNTVCSPPSTPTPPSPIPQPATRPPSPRPVRSLPPLRRLFSGLFQLQRCLRPIHAGRHVGNYHQSHLRHYHPEHNRQSHCPIKNS